MGMGPNATYHTRIITFRLYPTRRQSETLTAWLALHCELYNACLQERRDAWRLRRVSLDYYDQQNELPDLKKARPDLVPLGCNALQETARRVDRAFRAFFRRLRAGEAPGFPRFRSRARFDSLTYPSPTNWKILAHEGERGALQISNLGAIRMHGRPRVALSHGEPRTLTIRRRNGRWYASIAVRYPWAVLARPRPATERAVGLDAGVSALLTTSDGETIENPRHLARAEKALKAAQRALARKKRGSSNRKKARAKVARLHERVANRRRTHLHQVSTELVRTYTTLAVEDLRLRNMTRSAKGTAEAPGKNVKAKAGLNRGLLDTGIATLYAILETKAEEAGGRVVRVDPRYTSQDCSACGERVPKALAVRVHRCPHCGLVMDRDANAARNILRRGLEALGLAQAGAPRAETGRAPLGARRTVDRATLEAAHAR